MVTGAAGGIGRAVAAALASEGCRCLLLDLADSAVESLAAEINAGGGQAEAAPCDLADAAAIAAWFERFGDGDRLDILVNNAARIDAANLADTQIDEWRSILAVNVDAAMLMTQHAARRMRRQGPRAANGRRGTIVNLGAPVFETVPLNAAAYGTSKAAVRYLTALAAREFAGDLIATSLLYPGTVREGMWSRRPEELAQRLGGDAGEILRQWVAALPAGAPQEPAAVGRLVLYLATAPGMTQNGHVVWGAPYSVSL